MCKPGEYSSNGLSPCTIAPQGTYTDKYMSLQPIPCPSGTTTVSTGAISMFKCGS